MLFTLSFLLTALALDSPPSVDDRLREAVEAEVKPLVDSGEVVGLVVGVIDGDRTELFGFGKLNRDSDKVPDGQTLFEIGSISKTFTGLLLAEMAARGEVSLDEPAAKLLPEGVTMPRKGDREITLTDLSTHASGLPRLPSNMLGIPPGNPYKLYTTEALYKFLNAHTLEREPGEKSEYSNLGAGLLGHLLGQRAGKSYDELIIERITGPLAMGETHITLTEAQQARLAKGHTAAGRPTPNWDNPTLAGAGGLRSTGEDMMRYLRAQIDPDTTPIAGPIRESHRPRMEATEAGGRIALGWIVRPDGVTWHNGQTGGYHSFTGFDPERRLGVLILANSATGAVDSAGFALLKRLAEGDEPR